MVFVGEKSGGLDKVLLSLSDYYSTEERIRKKVIGALTYPIALSVLMVGVLSLMMLFVVPSFQSAFSGVGIEMPPLTVLKRSGNKEIFDRDKLALAVRRSVGKFFNSELEVEDVVNRATDILYSYGTDQITSKQIGDAVLDVLADVNEVAYVRFASVFREFKTLEDFEKILKEQKGKK